MRFDDTLKTVLAGDLTTPFGKVAAWRQLVDLIGRRRIAAEPRALALLEEIRAAVPVNVRAASARALELADPPYALVALCANDEICVAAPVLRSARLNSGEWVALLPRLSAAGREVIRGRRDLPAGVFEALATFAADFVLGASAAEPGRSEAGTSATQHELAETLARIRMRAATETDAGLATSDTDVPQVETDAAVAVATPGAPSTSFVSIGAAALSLPVVAAALEQAAGEGASSPDQTSEVADGTALSKPAVAQVAAAVEGPFEIADVVARIDAFYSGRSETAAAPVQRSRVEGFRFETDAQGVIRWVDGVARAPLIGLSLEMPATPSSSGVDGVATGAIRQRAAFSDARLVVAGETDAAGDWRISATAAFDPATGRFAGYRGSARRPRVEQDAARLSGGGAADSLRQLMHELRTPTNAIAGFAEMIERQMLGEVSSVYRERAAMIRDHARLLLAAIDDLDLAARIEASALRLQPGEVALRGVLMRVADDLAGLTTMRGAAVELPDGEATIVGDLRAVERLLSRLLATLASAAGAGERVAMSLSEGDGMVAISVTRPRALAGYSSEALFAIDDEREDAALLGTGFALRLIRNLAGELSGSLAIEPDRFVVHLPAAVTKSLEVVR